MTVAVVVGGARGVLKQYEQAVDLCADAGLPHVTLVVNDVITIFGGDVDHAVTLHADRLKDWLRERRDRGYSDPGMTWAQRQPRANNSPRVEKIVPEWGGSSGLYAVTIALLHLKLRKVILCGVPMDNQVHLIRGRPWQNFGVFVKAWRSHREEIAPYVRSFSGWTAELFGMPTQQFLEDNSDGA